jgi:putative transposase
MTTGYRFRANPPKPVAAVLLRWIGCQRFIKNAKVREDQYFRAFKRRFLEFAGQHAPVDQAYSHLIGFGNGCEDADTTWLRQVPGTVLRNGAVRFYQGYQRFFKGLALRPTISGRHGEQSVWLTSDCFRFEESVDADGVMGRKLIIGTKKFPCGELPFVVSKGCKNWKPPASLHISFSNDTTDQAAPSEEETLEHLRSFSEVDLMVKTVGLDRGVAVPLMAAGATGPAQSFKLLEVQHQRLAKKQIQRARWQLRAAKAGLYATCVRQDFAHQTSRALVSFTLKEKKSVGGLRRTPADSPEAIQSVGLGESEPSGTQVPSTLVEIRVSRKGQKPLALRSVKQETPTTALRA